MTPVQTFLCKIASGIINPAITLLALGAMVMFIWGVVEFIRGANESENRKKGQEHMLWGIVGLVIIFGARVIVAIIAAVAGVASPFSC